MPRSVRKFAAAAFLFEAGLGLAAVAIGRACGADPLASIKGGDLSALLLALLWGALATLPMVAGLWVLDRYPGPLVEFKQFVEQQVVPLFRGLSVVELAGIAAAAGIGEELLFRGLIQGGLAVWLGPPQGPAIAFVVASLAFGVCHWVNSTYAALATLIGLYLGMLMILADSLLAPIFAHAAYDFVALLYLVRRRPGAAPGGPAGDDDPLAPPRNNGGPTEAGPSPPNQTNASGERKSD